jgi:hypothetical protein
MAISLGANGITANGYEVIQYDSSTGQLEIFHNNVSVLQTDSGGASTFTGSLNGRLQTARNITLTGDASGTVSFDGSGNVSIATAVTNITSSQFSSAVTLNIINSAGTIVKTIKSPGS